MSKQFRLQLTLDSLLIYTIAFCLGACATITGPSSNVRIQQLEMAHLAFISNYTRPADATTSPPWNQARFDSEVAKITQQFNDAEAAESKAVPARKEFIRNSADLFDRDAAFVAKHHFFSPAFAASKKKQLQQNYDLFLKTQTSH
jgi:hypothetical protein